jgi:hypothetical protein
MKTAMQELIELVEKGETRLDLIENHKQIWLEKEKGQIIEGVEFGLFNADTTIDGQEYYNQKYNQNK